MQQFLTIWRNLTIARRAIVVGTTLAVFLAILAMSRLVTQPNMTLLYSGLDPVAAGDVIEALQQKGIAFDVQGTSVFVPGNMRDQLRLVLASEGLPASSGDGYELLDSLTGFGTTSQMFDAAYLRAKEGELARTIVSSPAIASARVHIATGSDNPFRRDLAPSASVHVTSRSGTIDQSQVQAIRHLVASAVAGLDPDGVAIIDAKAGLLSDDKAFLGGTRDTDRADLLRDRVLRLVEARVGRGNAVVEVSVDAITDLESITERRFDPESRFVISSDSEERSDQSENAGAGGVTVASNLPDGEANGTETETRQTAETRERLNYEVSQTTREIVRNPGAIKRLTVAVMVNGTQSIDAQGVARFVPVPEQELNDLRELVASAVGFDEMRGDVITLRSLSFEPMEAQGSLPAAMPWFSGPLDTMRLIQVAVLAIVVLVLALFVIRPLLIAPRRAMPPPIRPMAQTGVAGALPAMEVLEGVIEPDSGRSAVTRQASALEGRDTIATEDAVSRLKSLIEERRSETVEVLRNWLDEPRSEDLR